MIAALYVIKSGPYFRLWNVDPWDKDRDAKKYQGPYPVIAHPPCQLWGKMAKVNFHRWGGEHNRPGNDGGMFQHALHCVREYFGVLEHPAFSLAWDEYKLRKPKGIGWNHCGGNEWVCEVWQSAYGHLARKRTWLFYKGQKPHELNWDRPNGTHQIGGADQRGKQKNKPTISGKKASLTPILFRNELIKLAENSV